MARTHPSPLTVRREGPTLEPASRERWVTGRLNDFNLAFTGLRELAAMIYKEACDGSRAADS